MPGLFRNRSQQIGTLLSTFQDKRILSKSPAQKVYQNQKFNYSIKYSNNWQVCDIIKYAAIALGKIGDSRAIEPLAEAFEKEITYDEGYAEWENEEERFYRRSYIAGALCLLGDNTKLAVVIEGLNSSDNDIRYTAVQVLAECGDKRSLEVLEQQLKVENDLMIRLAIGDVLEKLRIYFLG